MFYKSLEGGIIRLRHNLHFFLIANGKCLYFVLNIVNLQRGFYENENSKNKAQERMVMFEMNKPGDNESEEKQIAKNYREKLAGTVQLKQLCKKFCYCFPTVKFDRFFCIPRHR